MSHKYSSVKVGVFVMGIVALLGVHSSGLAAQSGHDHAGVSADAQDAKSSALIKVVRDATDRYQDVEVAKADGYALQFGCVSGSDFGAMGMHFVNGPLVGDGELDPARPEIVIYEPLP